MVAYGLVCGVALRCAGVLPVNGGVETDCELGRVGHVRIVQDGLAGFNYCYGGVGIFGKAVCDSKTGGATADYNFWKLVMQIDWSVSRRLLVSSKVLQRQMKEI